MEGPIFDTHAHYTSHQFESDMHELLAGMPEQGVMGICTCATHSGDALDNIALAERYPFVWAAVGIHPQSLIEEDTATLITYKGDWRAELRDMRPLFDHPRVVAVGECGLDHHWPVPAEPQLEMFEEHIRLSMELDKPIIVHDREAHAETYALLKQYKPKGVVHCFSGSADDAIWIAEQGMYLGFGGSCTFKGAKRAVKALQAVPLESIVLETDCPYLAPQAVKGTRNHSANLHYVAEWIAECKQVDVQTVYNTTYQNALRLYNITK